MSLAQLIVNDAALALSIIKNYVGQPNVGGVPIRAVRCDCIMEAEVSRKVLINLSQQLQNVMDNVAPGPRMWEIEGTIGGLPGELTSLYMPSLQLMISALQGIFQARQQTSFIDPYFNTAQVLISRFEYGFKADTQNRVPVKISLVELTVLQSQLGSDQETPEVSAASPVAGSSYAAPAASGAMTSTQLPLPPVLQSGPSFVSSPPYL